jgi:hypothetical protein
VTSDRHGAQLAFQNVSDPTFDASQRTGALQVAAELAASHPRLVFRNPEKVTQGWELARKQRAMFIEFFGSDLIVVPGPEVASRMNGFLTWHTRRVLEEAGPSAGSLDAGAAARTPASACRRTLPARRPSHWPMTKRKA